MIYLWVGHMGSMCTLFRKSLAHLVSFIDTYDCRITAISFTTNYGLVLLICVMDNVGHGGTFPWMCQSCTEDAR